MGEEEKVKDPFELAHPLSRFAPHTENHPLPKNITIPPNLDVVSDCITKWFQDTLKEAKSGDLSMQVLVAQNGYGIPKDHQKAKMWMTRAARVKSSVLKVSNKRPGYNASDSDSAELLNDS